MGPRVVGGGSLTAYLLIYLATAGLRIVSLSSPTRPMHPLHSVGVRECRRAIEIPQRPSSWPVWEGRFYTVCDGSSRLSTCTTIQYYDVVCSEDNVVETLALQPAIQKKLLISDFPPPQRWLVSHENPKTPTIHKLPYLSRSTHTHELFLSEEVLELSRGGNN